MAKRKLKIFQIFYSFQHFLRPCAKLKSNIKKLEQHGRCQFFFSKITLPYRAVPDQGWEFAHLLIAHSLRSNERL